ncbi:MAG: LCP family protein [Eubacterium sp.]|nr:LCP family protein [Eubacterium sp.]
MSRRDEQDEARLRAIQEETRRKKEELERLQMEELHQIREMERRKMAGEDFHAPDDMDLGGRRDSYDDGPVRSSERVQEDRKRADMKRKSIKKVSDVDDISFEERQERSRRMEERDRAEARRRREAGEERPGRREAGEERPRRREAGGERPRSQRSDRMRDEEALARERKLAERDRKRRDAEQDRENREIQRELNRKRKKKHPVAKFFTVLLVIILILGIIGGVMIHKIVGKFDKLETEVSKRSTSMQGNIVNILLVGQDAREGQGGQRSDSMIICSINKTKRSVTLISIMRDTYVQIPGYGGNRVNAAFAFGGYDLLDQTIEENFGITIDGNAEVDFEGFLTAMTAIGDLDIELTQEEADYMNTNQGLGYADDGVSGVDEWHLTAGVNSLNPNQVLAYSRMRYVGNSDWDRTARQRKVISAAMSKVKHGHFISGYKMASAAAPSIATDVKTSGMLSCALPVIFSGDNDSYLIPADGTYNPTYVDGMAVLVPDIDKNRELIQQYINGTYEEPEGE